MRKISAISEQKPWGAASEDETFLEAAAAAVEVINGIGITSWE